MKRFKQRVFRCVLGVTAVTLAGSAYAQRSKDMLMPEEVPLTGGNQNPLNQSAAFMNLGLLVGQSSTSDVDSDPDLGGLLKVGPGYSIGMTSWTRLEIGLDLAFGQLEMREGIGDTSLKIPVRFGFMPHVGYGVSLGHGMFLKGKVNVGLVNAAPKWQYGDVKVRGESEWNFTYGLGAETVIMANKNFGFVMGLHHQVFRLDVEKTRSQNVVAERNENLSVSLTGVDFGARFYF